MAAKEVEQRLFRVGYVFGFEPERAIRCACSRPGKVTPQREHCRAIGDALDTIQQCCAIDRKGCLETPFLVTEAFADTQFVGRQTFLAGEHLHAADSKLLGTLLVLASE